MASPDASELFQPETLELIERLAKDDTPDDVVRTISRLRAEGHSEQRVHHAVEQVRLRRKARSKFGDFASQMLFTEAGLEQATRLSVAAHHAGRFRQAGCDVVADLGCGIGADSLAIAALGIGVLAVDKDPLTAAIAEYNLASFNNAQVIETEAMSVDLSSVSALWLDPARRQGTIRMSSPDDWSPRLDDAFSLAPSLPRGVKLAPGMDRGLIPPDTEAQWVSVMGDVVEMVVWTGQLKKPNVGRSALVLGSDSAHQMEAQQDSADAATGDLGEYLYEPDGAVIRARLIGDLARSLGGVMIDPTIAYITSNYYQTTPFAQVFRVEGVLSTKLKDLSQWVKAHEVGTLEIKKRGIDVDPSALRTQLRLRGSQSKTLILTRIRGKKVAIAASRMPAHP